MFICNPEKTEIINVNEILAVHTAKAVNQISVHLDSHSCVFKANSSEDLFEYESQIEMSLYSAANRWAKCGNWLFRADKITHANIFERQGLSVHMGNKLFFVPCNGNVTKEDLMTEFLHSISYPLMSDRGPNLYCVN